MTDFASLFWDYYIAILTLVSVLACAALLKMQSTHRVQRAPGAETTSVETTGHVWDGDIQELNQPMPRWWMWLFYLTVFFSLAYLVLYPGLGSVFKGTLAWSSDGEHQADVEKNAAVYGPLYDRYLAMDLAVVAQDLRARQMGERLFQNNCASCHGVDARGTKGFPNLTDAEWLYGNAPEVIKTSITEGRSGMMPPMAAALGDASSVQDVAHYVLSLSGSPHDSARAARGQPKFMVCAACHGMEGKGNQQLGAPDLSNRIWLYGGTEKTIVETITQGRQGMMPAHKNILTPGEIHVVAAYVLSLSTSQSGSSVSP